MFCSNCGNTINAEGQFCAKCGTPRGALIQQVPPPPPQKSTGNPFSTAGIICGVIAFLVVPILFGPIGLILGAIAHSKGEEKAVVALVVSGIGLVAGMIIGALVFGAFMY
jgi:hypothetical protein